MVFFLRARVLVTVALVSLLGACQEPRVNPGASLSQMDGELADVYARATARRPKTGERAVIAADHQALFADLSDRAAAAAASSDGEAAIGFYRVATIAAWRSGDLRFEKVAGLADRGRRLCEGPPPASVARSSDCHQMDLAVPFATSEHLAREVDALTRPSGGDAEAARAARAAVLAMKAAFDTVGMARTRMLSAGGAPLPADFVPTFVDANRHVLRCDIGRALGMISRVMPTDDVTDLALKTLLPVDVVMVKDGRGNMARCGY